MRRLQQKALDGVFVMCVLWHVFVVEPVIQLRSDILEWLHKTFKFD